MEHSTVSWADAFTIVSSLAVVIGGVLIFVGILFTDRWPWDRK